MSHHKISLVIEHDCSIQVFCNDVEMHVIGQDKIPTHVSDIITLENILKNMKKTGYRGTQNQPSKCVYLIDSDIFFNIAHRSN